MRLLLVDLSSVAYPIWHAAADKPIGFMHEGAVAKVRRAAEGFDRVVIACDAGRSFRKDLADSYKAHRPDRDPTLHEQLDRVKETLAADGYLIAQAEGFEADDVVATFARWATTGEPPPFAEVEILSADKDLLALATPSVRVRSAQTGAVLDDGGVFEKLKVRPDQVRDYLALMGDASDGVRGVPGVGKVNAAALLRDFGSIAGITTALDGSDAEGRPLVRPAGIHAALLAAIRDGSLALAQKLITLRADAPVDCTAALERRAPKPAAPDASWNGEAGDAEFEDAPPAAEVGRQPAPSEPERPAPAPAEQAAETGLEAVGGSAAAMVVHAGWAHALEPRSARDAYILAKHLFESRLFGAYGNPDAVFATVLAGRELGIPALTALRSIHIIEGKPTLSAHLIVAMVLRSGLADYFRMVESTDEKSTYETRRKGDPEPTRITYTIGDAEQAGLLRPTRNGKPSNWTVRPKPMLRKAAAVELARAVYPDVASNVYDPDELEAP